jgi:hypothetical protein
LRDSFELSGQDLLSGIFVSSCVTVLEGAVCGASRHAIPLPRSNRATIYNRVPVPLRAFNSTFGLRHDHHTGAAGVNSISTDLHAPPAMLRGQTPAEGATKLKLDWQGSKTLKGGSWARQFLYDAPDAPRRIV